MSAPLAGAAVLLKATIRHEGRSFVPWMLSLVTLSASAVLVYPYAFPTEQDRAGLSAGMGANPAIGLIFGPAFDLTTVDGFNAWRSLGLGGLLMALGAIFAVTRSTRAQEDSGQAELLASGVLGRSSRLLAGVTVSLVGSLSVGAICGVLTVWCGGGWEASLLLGATFAASGWMFTAVAAVTAQIGSDSRTANSLAVGTLGVLFLLRGLAYAVDAPRWAVWANPLGWMTQTRPASGDHWWPLAYAGAFTIGGLLVAFVIQERRDFGQGVIAPRPGPDRGRIRSSMALAVRLNRGQIIIWAIAFAGLGFAFGYFATSITELLSQDSAVVQILAAGATTQEQLVSAFLITILNITGIIAAVPGVQLLLKVRAEEIENRVEPLIATPLGRTRYYGSHVVLAFVASAAFLLISGLIVAALAASAGFGVTFIEVAMQALVTIPALWCVVAVAVAVVGARPAVAIAAWLGVLLSFVFTLLGRTFNLPDAVLEASPFWHIPDLASPGWNGWGLLGVTVVACLLLLVGFSGFRRRDLAR